MRVASLGGGEGPLKTRWLLGAREAAGPLAGATVGKAGLGDSTCKSRLLSTGSWLEPCPVPQLWAEESRRTPREGQDPADRVGAQPQGGPSLLSWRRL